MLLTLTQKIRLNVSFSKMKYNNSIGPGQLPKKFLQGGTGDTKYTNLINI